MNIREARASTGRLVAHSPAGGHPEYGRIIGTSDTCAFVEYRGDQSAKATSPADLELVILELRPGPAEIAAAWIPPGATLTLRGVDVEPRDRDLGWYLAIPGQALPSAGQFVWRVSPQGLRTAMQWSGMAMWETAARELSRAARESLGPLALYVSHEETVTGTQPERPWTPVFGWRATRIRRNPL